MLSKRLMLIAIAVVGSITAASAADLTNLDGDLCTGRLKIPGFVPAEVLERPVLRFPEQSTRDLSEGWVLVEHTVARDGSVKDMFVRHLLGRSTFGERSEQALAKSRFKPATRNGVPVEQYGVQTSVIYRFADIQRSVTHGDFVRKYQAARSFIAEGKYREAIDILEKVLVNRLNLYELARASLSLAVAYAELGEHPRAYEHALNAIVDGAEFLERDLKPPAFELAQRLAHGQGDYAGEVCLFLQLAKIAPGATSPGRPARQLHEAVLAALRSPDPLVTSAILKMARRGDGRAAWAHTLMRPKFWFHDIQGETQSFRLVCTTTLLEAPIDADMNWTVPPEAGPCTLYVSGAADASFKLVEENAEPNH